MMTTEVQIITSVALSDDDLNSVTRALCSAVDVAPPTDWTSVSDGVAQLWLFRLTAKDTAYEEADIDSFAMMLGAPPAHYLQIAMDSEVTSYASMLLLVKLMSQRWPLVLDNCHDRYYGPGQIAEYISGEYD